MRSLLALSGLLLACSSASSVLVEAHRLGAGAFPQNSAAALRHALLNGLPGIELDLVLSQDGVPFLAHDPWVHQTLCTWADGTPLPQEKEGRIGLKERSAMSLKADFLCGGLPDEDFPDAAVQAEPMQTLDEVLEALKDNPQVLVHLDVKYEPGLTATPEAFAEAILSRWAAAGLPNAWYVSANLPEALRAFKEHPLGAEVETSLIWPRFPPDSESQQVAIALKSELRAVWLGIDSLVGLAKEAGADGLAIAYQVADRQAIETARAAGLKVRLWTLNSASLLKTYCDWPLDGLITDYPERAPCL